MCSSAHFVRWLRLIFLALASVGAAGCVPEIEPTLITRYQQALQRHPKVRPGKGPLDLLRPSDGIEPLKVVDDPLTGAKAVEMTVDQAIRMAMRNSMDIRVVSFDPGIAQATIEEAAGAFDVVVFGGVNHTVTDERTTRVDTSIPGSAVDLVGSMGEPFSPQAGYNRQKVTNYNAGLREHMITGGDIQLSWDLTRTSNNNLLYIPNANYNSRMALSLVHPLLRKAGTDYNLAAMRIAAINTKTAYAQFRQQVETTVTQVQTYYWQLVQARQQFLITQKLMDKTVETLERVRQRHNLDATAVEIKQAESAMEARLAVLVRARKAVFDTQDQLARLVVDPKVNLLSAYAIVPTTKPVTNPITVDPADQLVQALRYSPVLEQARLGISVADIQVTVAKNELLPKLDLTASTGIQGLDGKPGSAGHDMGSFNFIDYSIGAVFEYPLANRTARATLRQRSLERLKAVSTLQNTADQVALLVNQSVRQIQASYDEMLAQRAAKEAGAIELQALEDTERIRGKLTPEFLQLKLQAQVNLAEAAAAEAEATANFNSALVQLAQATGTTLQRHNIKLAVEDTIAGNYSHQFAWPEATVGPEPAVGSGNIKPVTSMPTMEFFSPSVPQ